MAWPAIVAAGVKAAGSIGGGLLGKSSSKKAAEEAEKRLQQASELTRSGLSDVYAEHSPYMKAGQHALQLLLGEPTYDRPYAQEWDRITPDDWLLPATAESGLRYPNVSNPDIIKMAKYGNEIPEWETFAANWAAEEGWDTGEKNKARRIYNNWRAINDMDPVLDPYAADTAQQITGYKGGMLDELLSGLGEDPGASFDPATEPGYQFGYEEFIEDPLLRQASAAGRLPTDPATQKALTRYAEDYASTKYQDYVNRQYQELEPIWNLLGLGSQMTQSMGALRSGYQNTLAELLAGQGAYAGSGQMAGSNAMASAIPAVTDFAQEVLSSLTKNRQSSFKK